MKARTALAAALLGLVALLPGTAPAWAKGELLYANPAEHAELDETPGWVTLVFSANVDPSLAKIVVVDASGGSVTTGPLIVEDSNVTTQLLYNLPEGTYTVWYRATDADGEPFGGSYQFAVGKGQWASASPTAWTGGDDEPPLIATDDPAGTTAAPYEDESSTAAVAVPTNDTAQPSGEATADSTPTAGPGQASPSASADGATGPTPPIWAWGLGAVVVVAIVGLIVFRRQTGKPKPND
ncbi:MAG: copper resistance protein CopC [Propionibacteriaceae bacterium]|nr:copper resistance protein CopC [Propionibacteriaceae bacterium]